MTTICLDCGGGPERAYGGHWKHTDHDDFILRPHGAMPAKDT